ncbi:ion transporter [Horticoccus sp. 23ND18S-11]|uniref:ion transporter n=1 Tax=Horticoccus sp. 23ND18S-11 TaxID=3391832 RepID=UPI0039C8E725
MQTFCQRLAASAAFQRSVLALILLAGLLVGLETHAGLVARFGDLLHAVDRVVLVLFVVELVVRIGACGAQVWRFFRDPWNVFDFAIVAVCVLPIQAEYSAVLRLARVLRVLRLITAVPRLQLLVTALLRSLPSMSYVALLLCVLFYVYAVLGVGLFGRADPAHFGSLGASGLTLFQIVTLEGWAEIMREQLAAGASPTLTIAYFVSFILLGTMITLNLLIGVIVTGMDEARREMEDDERERHRAATGAPTPADDVAALSRQVEALQTSLAALQRRLK